MISFSTLPPEVPIVSYDFCDNWMSSSHFVSYRFELGFFGFVGRGYRDLDLFVYGCMRVAYALGFLEGLWIVGSSQ